MKTKTHIADVSKEQFEDMVSHAYQFLPQRIKKMVDNVALVTYDVAPDSLVEEMRLDSSFDLLGLYTGSSLAERDYDTGIMLPDVITLFRLPCIREAKESGTSIEDVVYETLWHEIGHHFGLDERGVAKKEKEGRNKRVSFA